MLKMTDIVRLAHYIFAHFSVFCYSESEQNLTLSPPSVQPPCST